MPNVDALIAVLQDTCRMLESDTGDYSWSSWESGADAAAAIGALIVRLRAGAEPTRLGLQLYFAPTGPIQEAAIDGGWGDYFLELADRFDAAIAAEPATRNTEQCSCWAAPVARVAGTASLGMDDAFAEVSVLTCAGCGQQWLRYYYVVEAFSRSGRWYLGAISSVQRAVLTAADACRLLGEMDWYFQGGSYFNGLVSRASGPISLYP